MLLSFSTAVTCENWPPQARSLHHLVSRSRSSIISAVQVQAASGQRRNIKSCVCNSTSLSFTDSQLILLSIPSNGVSRLRYTRRIESKKSVMVFGALLVQLMLVSAAAFSSKLVPISRTRDCGRSNSMHVSNAIKEATFGMG